MPAGLRPARRFQICTIRGLLRVQIYRFFEARNSALPIVFLKRQLTLRIVYGSGRRIQTQRRIETAVRF